MQRLICTSCVSPCARGYANPAILVGHKVFLPHHREPEIMAKLHNKLNARTVETIARTGRHADGGNLFLSISKNGGRRWVFLYRWRGTRREMGLGSAARDGVSLADARDLAGQARAQLQKGVDPLTARQFARDAAEKADRANRATAATFGQIADQHVEAMESSWANEKHRHQWRYSLETLAAELRPKPIDSIDTAAVLDVLRPLWKSVPETASRLRGQSRRCWTGRRPKAYEREKTPQRGEAI